jgi:hypothetical protein
LLHLHFQSVLQLDSGTLATEWKIDFSLMSTLQQALLDLIKASHETKAELAALAKVSHDTNQQLAHLQQSVSAMQAKLFGTTTAADEGFSKAEVHAVQHRDQRFRVSDDYITVLARVEVLC